MEKIEKNMETGTIEMMTGTERDRSTTKKNATRKIMVIGCGDGGSNITSAIVKALPADTFGMIYNTSDRAMAFQKSNISIRPFGVDGSGKVRSFATEIFKDPEIATGRRFMERAKELIDEMGDLSYIVVVGTADGGTGSGTVPIMAKLLRANLDIPVIVMGVYPSIAEDAMSQFNAIQWQQEINDAQVPYIILDNSTDDPNMDPIAVHEKVNRYAVEIIKLLSGNIYGDTDISIIDNRNLYMLIEQMGGRIVIATENGRPSNQTTLDDHILRMLERNYQPEPSDVRGIGVFIKGPEDMITRYNTSIQKVQEKYGYAILKFAHVQVDKDPAVAILLSGCSEATDRLLQMQGKYDDLMRAKTNGGSRASALANDMVNPVGTVKKAGKKEGLDFSVLEG